MQETAGCELQNRDMKTRSDPLHGSLTDLPRLALWPRSEQGHAELK